MRIVPPRKYLMSLAIVLFIGIAIALPNRTTVTLAERALPDGLRLAGTTPTATFDHAGNLWLTWINEDHVFVGRSDDHGKTLTHMTRVTREVEIIDANGEARPKISFGLNDEIYVAWTRRGQRPFTGDIRFSRSTDSGQTFNLPVTVNDDRLPIGHRFESLGVNQYGDIFLVWIDKRDLESAILTGKQYSGAALYYAWSQDRGESFSRNRKIKDQVCECCRIGLSFQDNGWPVILWREVLTGNIRDHAVVRFTGRDAFSKIRRVNYDNWKIEGCPHHGPGFDLDTAGYYHIVWFTGDGEQGPGVFYTRSLDNGKTFSHPVRVGSKNSFGHADILAFRERLYVVWKERVDEDSMGIFLMTSDDAGVNWTREQLINKTNGGSDHPLLIADEDNVFLSWFTRDDGYHLTPITGL